MQLFDVVTSSVVPNSSFDSVVDGAATAAALIDYYIPVSLFTPPGGETNPNWHRMRKTVNDIVLPVIFGLGVIGNVLNAILMTRRRDCGPSSSTKSSNRRRSDGVAGGCMVPDARSPTVFERSAAVGLIALTSSDLAFCLVGFARILFVGVPADWRAWNIVGIYYSAKRGALLNLFLFTSTWIIALISVERCLAVCHPFRASVLIRVRRTIAAHAVVAAVAVLVNVPLFLRNTVSSICSPPQMPSSLPP